MGNGARRSVLWLGLILFLGQVGWAAEPGSSGNVVGFVFDKDGTTPYAGAIVKFKSLTSGAVYESSRSDALGVFRVQGVETGLYSYGVVTEAGDFNAESIVGLQIAENETAKLSIALNRFENEVASAVTEMYREPAPNGEVLVGTIADFDQVTKLAQVEVVKGLVRVKDRIHAKGKSTDFYQEVDTLMVGQNTARQILSGQTGTVKLERRAQRGDMVYVARNRKAFPLFLAPAGLAAVIAGNSSVTQGIVSVQDKSEPVSAFKN